jgi:hypothetical protein
VRRTSGSQWVLTFPFAWRRRLGQDGALLSALTRLFVDTVHSFHAKRAAIAGGVLAAAAKSGAVTVVQRTSSDLRLNPHLHVVFLDGAYYEQGPQLAWQALGHLQTREVGQVLERVVRRIDKHLRRRGLLAGVEPNAELEDPDDQLAASAVSGQAPPAGPQWRRGLLPLRAAAHGYDKPLCASLAGFTLHAATRAGALDPTGREKLLRYVLRPPVAYERFEQRPEGWYASHSSARSATARWRWRWTHCLCCAGSPPAYLHHAFTPKLDPRAMEQRFLSHLRGSPGEVWGSCAWRALRCALGHLARNDPASAGCRPERQLPSRL